MGANPIVVGCDEGGVETTVWCLSLRWCSTAGLNLGESTSLLSYLRGLIALQLLRHASNYDTTTAVQHNTTREKRLTPLGLLLLYRQRL